jgi:hypothetical protein
MEVSEQLWIPASYPGEKQKTASVRCAHHRLNDMVAWTNGYVFRSQPTK